MSLCLAITETNWAVTKDVFGVIGTLVSAAGVGVAAYVGCSGLKTWKRQNKGTSDHDLARRILIEMYKYRDALSYVRSPALWSHEVQLSKEERIGLSSEQEAFKGQSQAYHRRLAEADRFKASLLTNILESEAVWGREVKELFEPLFKLHSALAGYIGTYLRMQDPYASPDMREAYRKIHRAKPDILYYAMDGESDAWADSFNSLIFEIEEVLRKRLIR
ncbi:hypothetical protein LZ023_26810 [Pseudomonas silvicola]|nr:hypothetical protein LZ023_26810 [Pseudomonas silvicola]